jgi:hypothetical protein
MRQPSCLRYDPLPQIAYNPGEKYYADRAVWNAYAAALIVNGWHERKRCQAIVRGYLAEAPENVRLALLDLITDGGTGFEGSIAIVSATYY